MAYRQCKVTSTLHNICSPPFKPANVHRTLIRMTECERELHKFRLSRIHLLLTPPFPLLTSLFPCFENTALFVGKYKVGVVDESQGLYLLYSVYVHAHGPQRPSEVDLAVMYFE